MANKNAGDRLRFNSIWSYKTPGFEANDLGFMVRADQRQLSNWLQIRRDEPTRWGRNVRVNVNQWHGWNFDGDRIQAGGNVNAHITLPNNWRTGAGVTYNAEAFDDWLTRGGPGGYRDPRVSLWQYVETDERPAVSVNNFVFMMRDDYGLSTFELSPELNVRPTSAVQLGIGVKWARNLNPRQWVENVEDGASQHYVFGDLDQKTLSMRLRLNYTMRPALSLQLYAEPFVSSGRYSSFTELVDGRADFDHRYAPVRLRRTAGLPLHLAAYHERAALGAPSGVNAVRRLAAGPRAGRRPGEIPVRARHPTRVLRSLGERAAGEDRLLVQFLTFVRLKPDTTYGAGGAARTPGSGP